MDDMIEQTPTMTYDELSHRWRIYLWHNRAEGETQSCRDEFYAGVVRGVEVSLSDISFDALPLKSIHDRSKRRPSNARY